MAHTLAKLFVRLNGWETEGERPTAEQFVLIAAPHTSNWDLPYMLAFAGAYDLDVSWMAKHTLFVPPMGWIFGALGGIAVKRDRARNMVDQMADQFRERERLILVVPAEGTRGYVPHWKSGFYHIAQAAGVPIVPSFLDYKRKVGGFGPALSPTGDISGDMDVLRRFYANRMAKYPDKFGEVRLKEEM
jgi:1-acyl-sn-glycerol-3-phosphate acyltransferase